MNKSKDFSEFPPLRNGSSTLLLDRLNIFQSLINAIPIPLFYKDTSGLFLACNVAFENLTGLQKADIGGNDFLRDIPGGNAETAETDLSTDREVVSSKSSTIYNTVLHLGPQKPIHAIIIKTPIMDDAGNIEGIFGIVINTVHENYLGARLADTEGRYHLLFNNTADGVLLTTPEGEILAANKAACRMFGRTESELQQVGRDGIIDSNDPRFFAALKQRERTGTMKTEHFYIRKDGTRFLAQVSSNIFQDSTGRLLASTIIRDVTKLRKAEEEVKRDVTERKRLESLLAKSEKQYRDIYNNITEGIFQISKRGKFISANPSLAAILGYETPQELMGSVVRAADIWTSPDDFKTLLRRLEVERRVTNFEVRLRKRNDTLCWMSINVYIVSDDQGEPFYEGTAVDIDDRRSAKDLLKEQTGLLQDTTAALRVLLKQREQDKSELERTIVSNLSSLVLPYLSKLQTTKLTEQQSHFVNVVRNNLNDIVAPFATKMGLLGLTGTELTIINLIKNGSATKDVMAALNMSKEAVDLHRYHIRKKLGITNTKTNLQAHLKSML